MRPVILLLCLALGPGLARAERMSYLDNGTLRIGVNLDIGGTITHLSRSGDDANLINSHDLGRQIQQSYYAGPRPFDDPHPSWKGWPWNPIGSGDTYGNPARVIEHHNDGSTLHVRTIPMQWALDNVPGDCTFETWIALEGDIVRVRCRLNNARSDTNQYPASNQELPAVYTVGTLYRLFTYTGDRPFEDGPLARIENAGPPWESWTATENWAALVNDDDWGLGVIHPGVYSFIGGFHGTPNRGGPKDNPTGYIAPVRREILDHNIVYEYSYLLTLGTLEEIRARASEHRVKDPRPDYRFTHDRQHWTYVRAEDDGFPLDGTLTIRPTGDDPQFLGPEQWWQAGDVPRLHIRAAFRTRSDRAELFWSVPGASFNAERRLSFPIQPDGEFRTYTLDLSASPAYRGTITGLRLDPMPSAGDGDEEVRLQSISWKPPDHDH